MTTPDGKLWALDGKMNIDDNALFRHEDIAAMLDPESEEPTEAEARDADLSFVKLDGDIGCIVNGAGLAMATMDMVKFYGGMPANFLDIGGSSNPDKVVTAMNIITSDDRVKAVLFNIFGGITRCDDVANGIVTALETHCRRPRRTAYTAHRHTVDRDETRRRDAVFWSPWVSSPWTPWRKPYRGPSNSGRGEDEHPGQ